MWAAWSNLENGSHWWQQPRRSFSYKALVVPRGQRRVWFNGRDKKKRMINFSLCHHHPRHLNRNYCRAMMIAGQRAHHKTTCRDEVLTVGSNPSCPPVHVISIVVFFKYWFACEQHVPNCLIFKLSSLMVDPDLYSDGVMVVPEVFVLVSAVDFCNNGFIRCVLFDFASRAGGWGCGRQLFVASRASAKDVCVGLFSGAAALGRCCV